MANMNIKTEKILSPSNIKRIIALGISIRDELSNMEKGLISEYDSTVTYTKGMSCYYDGYLYKCLYTTTGDFDSTKWQKVGDELSLIDKQTLASMINLSDEEIASLQNLISTEIRLDKCFSSSDTYNRILNAENECKKFTLEELAKKAGGVVYKIVADTTGVDSTEYLYLISNGSGGYNIYAYIDGSAVKISDTNISLDGYAKLTDLADYLKTVDADGKYATIISLSNHELDTDKHTSATEKASYALKSSITDTIDSTSTSAQIASAKGVYNELDKKLDKMTVVKEINGKDTTKIQHIGIDLLADRSISGKTTRLFITDDIVSSIGLQVWDGSTLKKDVRLLSTETTNIGKNMCLTSIDDVPLTSNGVSLINNNTATGTVTYSIKNGYANVSINGINFTSGISCEISGLPIPSQYIYNNLGYAGSVVGEVYANANDNTLKVVMPTTGSTGYGFISYPVAES